jgi:hypothetical protein
MTRATFSATHVGVDTQRSPNKFTCNRCGIVKTINTRRRNDDGTYTVPDRRTYKCQDCLHVEKLERGTP